MSGWTPNRRDPEERLKQIERGIQRLFAKFTPSTSRGSGSGGGGSSSIGLPIPESDVTFDPVNGHDHDGSNSHTVDHANLANVLPDQHHAQAHTLGSATDHSDVLFSSVATGDLVYRNGSSKWVNRAIGSSNQYLGVSGGVPTWAQVAFSQLSGTLQTGQHGSLSDGDHTGDLTGNARCGVRKNSAGSTFKRRRHNFIEGSGITLTIADDSVDEEVDITIAASGGGAATITVQENDVTVDASVSTLDFLGADFDVTSSPSGEANVQLAATLDANARCGIRKNSAGSTFLRRRHNLIEGTGITLTVADDSGNEEVDITIAAEGSGKCYFGGWERSNINTGAGTSKTAMSWVGSSTNLGEVMPYNGRILGCSVVTGGDIGGAGKVYEVEVYASTDGGVSWSATGVVATITGGAGASDQWAWTSPPGSVAFPGGAGTILRLYDQRTGTLAGVDSHGGILVRFD